MNLWEAKNIQIILKKKVHCTRNIQIPSKNEIGFLDIKGVRMEALF